MEQTNLVKVYEGDEVSARLAFARVDNAGIQTQIAGSSVGKASSLILPDGISGIFEVLVREEDVSKALAILNSEIE